MSIFSAVVLLAVIWFLALLCILPMRIRTQGEAGSVVPGTPASAPEDAMIRGKLIWTTVVALVVWLPIVAVIIWGGLTVRDLDIWGRM